MLLMKKSQAANVREGTLSEMGKIPPQKEEEGAVPDWGGRRLSPVATLRVIVNFLDVFSCILPPWA